MNRKIKFSILAIIILIVISIYLISQEDIEPPPAILKIDGKEQVSGIGSYCWRGTLKALCADMIGIPTAQEPLIASSPFTAHIRLPIQESPYDLYDLRLNIAQVKGKDELNFSGRGWRWWKERGEKISTLPLEHEQGIELSLEPGLYVLSIGAWWKDIGSASYGFLVEVRTNGTVHTTPVPQEQAKGIAESKINEIKAQTDFVEWEELWADPNATVGMPYLVRSIDEKPLYWDVPVVLNEKVIGSVQVKMDGRIPRYGSFGCLYNPYYSPKNLQNCSSVVTIDTADNAKEIARNITNKYSEAKVSEPIYVFDDTGCCSGEAWMLKIEKDNKIKSRVFVQSGYAYERKEVS